MSSYLRLVYRSSGEQLLQVFSGRSLLKPAPPADRLAHGDTAAAIVNDQCVIVVRWDAMRKAFVTPELYSPHPV